MVTGLDRFSEDGLPEPDEAATAGSNGTQSRSADTQAQGAPGLTVRALVVAVALTILSGLWIRQSEIVALATQVSESVPASLRGQNILAARSRRPWYRSSRETSTDTAQNHHNAEEAGGLHRGRGAQDRDAVGPIFR